MIDKDTATNIIDRILRLEQEKKDISDDIKDIYIEAKGKGLKPPILRAAIALLKKPADERKEVSDGVDEILVLIGQA